MTITVNQEVKTIQAKEIPSPSFWKDDYYYMAFLDKNTIAKVMLRDDFASIVNGTVESMRAFLSDALSMKEITEQEFMSAYSEAYEAMRLEPRETGVYVSDLIKERP